MRSFRQGTFRRFRSLIGPVAWRGGRHKYSINGRGGDGVPTCVLSFAVISERRSIG